MKETLDLVHVIVWILNERRLVDMEEIRAWDGKWKQGYIEYLTKEDGYRHLETHRLGGWVKGAALNKTLKDIYSEYGTKRGMDQVILINDKVIDELTDVLIKIAVKEIRGRVQKMDKEEKERLYEFVKLARAKDDRVEREKDLTRYQSDVRNDAAQEELKTYALIRRLGVALKLSDFKLLLNKIS